VVAVEVEVVVMIQEHQLLQQMLEVKSPTLILILLVDLVEVVQVKDHLLLVVLGKGVLDRILVEIMVVDLLLVEVEVLVVLVLIPLVERLEVMVVLVFKFLQHSKIPPQHPDQLVVV
jgi:hypothetical protein